MSEPISAKELAALRETFKDTPRNYLPAWPMPALLDKIDSLTEALHATDEQIEELVAIEAAHKRCAADLATAEHERDDANARLHQCRADLAEAREAVENLHAHADEIASQRNAALADLADEKRRRADTWDEGYTAASRCAARGQLGAEMPPNPYRRALLDTATEETP